MCLNVKTFSNSLNSVREMKPACIADCIANCAYNKLIAVIFVPLTAGRTPLFLRDLCRSECYVKLRVSSLEKFFILQTVVRVTKVYRRIY